MSRSNRRRGRRHEQEPDEDWTSRVFAGMRRVESHRDGAWNVQQIAAASAQKSYVCPGCGNRIDIGMPHLVAWRADGLMGEADDLAARRHWHTHCWRIRT